MNHKNFIMNKCPEILKGGGGSGLSFWEKLSRIGGEGQETS